MNQVSDSIMRRTNNMTEFHPDDLYVIGMAERQMKATSEIRSLIYNAGKKGSWSGWKVKIDYQSRDRNPFCQDLPSSLVEGLFVYARS